MEKSFQKLNKIQLIEEPKSEDLLRSELEDALAGWTCTCYYVGTGTCNNGFSSNGTCDGGGNYCSSQYSSNVTPGN